MTEDQNAETYTAKAPEPEASPASSPKKGKRWVVPLIWALSILLALCSLLPSIDFKCVRSPHSILLRDFCIAT